MFTNNKTADSKKKKKTCLILLLKINMEKTRFQIAPKLELNSWTMPPKGKKHSQHRDCKNTSKIPEYACKKIPKLFLKLTFSSNLETQ